MRYTYGQPLSIIDLASGEEGLHGVVSGDNEAGKVGPAAFCGQHKLHLSFLEACRLCPAAGHGGCKNKGVVEAGELLTRAGRQG